MINDAHTYATVSYLQQPLKVNCLLQYPQYTNCCKYEKHLPLVPNFVLLEAYCNGGKEECMLGEHKAASIRSFVQGLGLFVQLYGLSQLQCGRQKT